MIEHFTTAACADDPRKSISTIFNILASKLRSRELYIKPNNVFDPSIVFNIGVQRLRYKARIIDTGDGLNANTTFHIKVDVHQFAMRITLCIRDCPERSFVWVEHRYGNDKIPICVDPAEYADVGHAMVEKLAAVLLNRHYY